MIGHYDQRHRGCRSQSLSEEGRTLVPHILQKLDEQKSEILLKFAEKNEVIETLKSENVVLKKRLVSLEDRVEELIALSCGSDLIISGNKVPLFTSGENCKDIVTDLIKNGLNCTMDSSGILESHRVGNASSTQRKNILIK